MKRICGGVVLVLLILGCGQEPSILGAWTLDATVGGKPSKGVVTFERDGKYHSEATVGTPGDVVMITATTRGTWKLVDGRLRVTLEDADWIPSGAPLKEAVKIHDGFLSRKREILAQYNAEAPKPITWNGRDEFSIPGGRSALTYRRKP